MIVVTGGSGFLGRYVLRALQKKNWKFTAWVRSRRVLEDLDPNQIKQIDFADPSAMQDALRGTSQILHLAGQINGPIEELRESNLRLTHRLVQAAQQASVKRIIFVSSAAAHLRKGPYGQVKWDAEEVVRSSGIPYLIFRPALIYGAGDTKNVATIEKLMRRLPFLPLLGGGEFLIQPVYVDDVVEALMNALGSSFENLLFRWTKHPIYIKLFNFTTKMTATVTCIKA